jgi:transcriptional regulator with XRE-family HTH domain
LILAAVSAAANQRKFGQNVRKHRKARGMSQEALADKAEMHFTAISMLERGEREPRLHTVVRVGYALGIEPGRLLDGIKRP